LSCLLCHSDEFSELFRGTDRLYRTTEKRFSVVRCRSCGMMRMEPAPEPHELAAYYPPHYWFRPQASLAGRLEERYRRLLIQDHVRFAARAWRETREAGPVLDVGCGGGLFLGMLREHGMRVVGLDASAEAADVAWHHNGVPTLCGDLARAPLPHASCAVVTMFHVVEHLADPRAYLRSARELLQPNGRLVVQVPNADCWQFALLGPAWSGVDVPRHLNDFRTRDIVNLVQSCGFEVVRTKQFSWRDNPAGLATSLATWLDPVARRVRGMDRGPMASLIKDAAYLALVFAALPFAALEAAFGAGSTVMVEAKKREL
jgi:SAM-dependent methyltransferase